MKASVIAAAIEETAPLSLQESWDNSGFCIGDGSCEVHKAIVGFDCTPALIEEAVEVGADMVITNADDLDNLQRIFDGEEIGTLFLAHKRTNFKLLEYLEEKPYFTQR